MASVLLIGLIHNSEWTTRAVRRTAMGRNMVDMHKHTAILDRNDVSTMMYNFFCPQNELLTFLGLLLAKAFLRTLHYWALKTGISIRILFL